MAKTQPVHLLPDLERRLLPWYDAHQRTLPWRAVPGYPPLPYHVWLSEIMLQQTTVATVKEYFCRFVTLWPTIEALAEATLDEVFHAWQGLGYYSRARNLHLCAQMIIQNFKGVFPQEESILLTLPGIGPYTAAAIAAIAYDQPVVPVDGNVVRVFSRLFSLEAHLPSLKKDVQDIAKEMLPSHRSGDFAQGLMDLGATVCRPRKPMCGGCPLQEVCQGYHQGIAGQLPRPAVKKTKPTRYGVAFWLENGEEKILLEKRPHKGLLAGLMGLPTTPWRETPWDIAGGEIREQAPKEITSWEPLPALIRHTFTHFHLELQVIKGQVPHTQVGLWSSLDSLKDYAFPTVMKKVIHCVTSSSCT